MSAMPSRLEIHSVFTSHCRADWSWDTGDGLPDHDLWLVLEGRGEVTTPEQCYAVERGACLLLRPGVHYRGQHNVCRPLSVLAIHFDGSGLEEIAEYRRLADPAFVEKLAGNVRQAWSRGDQRGAEHWLLAVLLQLQNEDRSQALGEQARAMETICRRIQDHPSTRYTVTELASELHCTRHHFSRLFRVHTGLSPSEYMIRARIDAARAMLRNSDHPIGRIAEVLGYSDVFFFSKQFKRVAGISPRAFRREPQTNRRRRL